MTLDHAPDGGREAPIEVLLVDDDATWLRTIARLLERRADRFTVTTAGDLSTARQSYADGEFDCVVCDFQLQHGDGFDLLAAVREREPDRPFVLITGEGDEALASEAIGRGVTDYIRKGAVGDRADLLAGRIERAVRSYRTERALERERRSKNAMLDILTAAASRTGLARRFCRHLVTDRGYDCAWVGTYDPAEGLLPRTVAGDGDYVDRAVASGASPDPDGEPALAALATGESVVRSIAPGMDPATDADGDATQAEWHRVAADAGFGTAAAVPVRDAGTTVGVLAVYTSDRDGVDDDERSLLEDYGTTLGYALRTADWKASLLSAMPVTVSVALDDESIPLVALARVLPSGRITVRTITFPDDGQLVYLAELDGLSLAEFRAAVDSVPALRVRAVLSEREPVTCELVATPPTPESVLADHGARFQETRVENGQIRVQVRCPAHDAVEPLRDALETAYGDPSVLSLQSDDAVSRGELLDGLTDKQREALRLAYYDGYFERPRTNNATEIAATLGVTRSTFTQHVRSAQRKLLDRLLPSR